MFIRKTEYEQMVNKLKFYREMLSDVAMLLGNKATHIADYDNFMCEQFILLKIREEKEKERLINLAEDVKKGQEIIKNEKTESVLY
jgi:hypothetical protein